jgi:hypothetical protein
MQSALAVHQSLASNKVCLEQSLCTCTFAIASLAATALLGRWSGMMHLRFASATSKALVDGRAKRSKVAGRGKKHLHKDSESCVETHVTEKSSTSEKSRWWSEKITQLCSEKQGWSSKHLV